MTAEQNSIRSDQPSHRSRDTVGRRGRLTDLAGRVAVVTGGSSGVGLGIAQACAAEGMRVVITGRTQTHLDKARRILRRFGTPFCSLRVDVTDGTQIREAAAEVQDRYGPVNLLCNNAGIGIAATVSGASSADWDDALSVNVMGIVNTLRAFLPGMLEHREPAHILSTSSMSGLFHGGTAGVYTTTKFAVVGMMEALRAELAEHDIGVSAFCPGFVRSKIYKVHRNRPSGYKSGGRVALEDDARQERFMADGMDPVECGRKVLSGVRRNAMHILTHPEYRTGLEERFAAVLAAVPNQTEDIPPARLEAERAVVRHWVYSAGLDASADAASGCGA